MKADFTDWLIAITIAMWSAVNIAAPSPWLNASVEETLAFWVGGWAIVFGGSRCAEDPFELEAECAPGRPAQLFRKQCFT